MRLISDPLTAADKLAVVGLDEVKAHLRLPLSFTAEDDLLQGMIETAYDFLSGPDGWLGGYCLLEETYQYVTDVQRHRSTHTQRRYHRYDFTPPLRRRYEPIMIPLRPVSTSLVEFTMDQETWAAMDAAAYRFTPGDQGTIIITPLSLPLEPVLRIDAPNAQIRITATAGVPVAKAAQIPAPIRQIIRVLVAEMYRNREQTSDVALAQVSFGLQALAGRYRFEPDHT